MIGLYWEDALLPPRLEVLDTTERNGPPHSESLAPSPLEPTTPPLACDEAHEQSTGRGLPVDAVTQPSPGVLAVASDPPSRGLVPLGRIGQGRGRGQRVTPAGLARPGGEEHGPLADP